VATAIEQNKQLNGLFLPFPNGCLLLLIVVERQRKILFAKI
jgi:hypothetical protein